MKVFSTQEDFKLTFFKL